MSHYTFDSQANDAPDLQHLVSNVLVILPDGEHVRKAESMLPLFEELHAYDAIQCPVMRVRVTCFPTYTLRKSEVGSVQTGHLEMRPLPSGVNFTRQIQEGFRHRRPLNTNTQAPVQENVVVEEEEHTSDQTATKDATTQNFRQCKYRQYRQFKNMQIQNIPETEICIGTRRMQLVWLDSLCIFMFRFQRHISTADRGGGAQNVVGVSGCFKIFSFENEFQAMLYNGFYEPDLTDVLQNCLSEKFDLVDERLQRNGIEIDLVDHRDLSVKQTINISLQGNIFAPPTGRMQLESIDSWDERLQYCADAMMRKACVYVFDQKKKLIDNAKEVLVAYVQSLSTHQTYVSQLKAAHVLAACARANKDRNQYIACVRASELEHKRRRLY